MHDQQVAALAEEIAGVGHWRLDVAARRVTWSSGMFRIYGLERTPEAPLAVSMGMIDPEDRARASADVAAAILTGESYEARTRITLPDGQRRVTDGRTVCEKDAEGRVIALIGTRVDVTQRVMAEAAMTAAYAEAAEQARRAEAAEAIAGLGHWRLDAITNAISWSDQMYRIYGLELGARLELPAVMAMTHADDAEACGERLRRALTTGATIGSVVTRIRRTDGALRYIAGRMVAERGSDGAVMAVMGTLVDVTEQTLAQAALAESEARFRQLAEQAADITVRIDLTDTITYVSSAVRRYGYEPEDIVGRSRGALLHEEHVEVLKASFAGMIGGGGLTAPALREFRLVGKDGREVWMEGSPSVIKDAAGAVTGVITVLRDVTERRAAETALAESEARYRLVTEASRDLILKHDADGVIKYISSSARHFGYAPEDLCGRRCSDFVHPEDLERVNAFTLAVMRDEASGEPACHYRLRAADGSWIWIEGNPSVVRDENGRFHAVINCLRDITERKAMEVELAAAVIAAEEAAAVKGDFLANMSHELRTPLTSVLGFTRLALERPGLDDTSRGYIRKASNAGAALLTTVNDILDFSALEAGQVEIRPRSTDNRRLIEETLELFSERAAEKGLSLSFEARRLPASLATDPDRVRQLLLNLVGNAVKFTDAGEIRVVADWKRGSQRLVISVIDQGPGLSGDQQARLFRRFSQVDGSSTRRHGGTGLGLAICRGLVEAMQGSIGVESSPGRGARFFFEIPAPRCDAVNLHTPAAPARFRRGTRVLVADDHPVNRELVRAILAPLGAQLTEACDGEQAVCAAARLPFDLILMDLCMPHMDGHDAMQAIRTGGGPNAHVPILAFSAGAESEGEARRRALGFDGDVLKPIIPATLIAAIAGQLWSGVDAASLRGQKNPSPVTGREQ
ncbi:MAG: multi-sensor hybrid histidine kinase [Caulobacter sp.]|nr:multi-sensor hybrid histidine kinase [Caulobacter sp.]